MITGVVIYAMHEYNNIIGDKKNSIIASLSIQPI